jgi:DNA-binding transcriptional ArsR family regulator
MSEIQNDSASKPGRSPGIADDATLERAARIFRAVADVSRLRILELLKGESLTVSELAQITKAGVSATSHQLRILWTERLVSRRRQGKFVLYGLADQHVADILAGVLDHVSERPESLKGSPR